MKQAEKEPRNDTEEWLWELGLFFLGGKKTTQKLGKWCLATIFNDLKN